MRKGIAHHEFGETFVGHMLVKSCTEGTAKNGSAFLNVTLSDATGEITAMVWSADNEKRMIFASGGIVHLRGTIGEFQGSRQITLNNYSMSLPEDNINPIDMLQSAPIEGKVLFASIISDVSGIQNETYKAITLDILNKYANEFKTHPAAKSVHHSYVSGLAFHTYSMLNAAKAVCELYPILRKDLLTAGTVLHDIGKIIEYSGYIGTEVTLEGRLKGHISIISEEIKMTAERLQIQDDEGVLLLQHMVLSHHGLQSHGWGSAVSPLIIEAEILHQIDKLDAGMDAYKSAVQNTKPGEFTNKIFGLDNRSFYNPIS